ncbi:YraN family protein [Cognatishimia sp. D5M38]|uniref:UPF0102 protein WG622_12645 n=1 Tax=Cognatishimia coralii TaxID=3083254 RepID=A0ABU8QI52_9RHOB
MFIDRPSHFANAKPVQLELNFDAGSDENPALQKRQVRGRRAYFAGQAAEATVDRLYQQRGYEILARRWRGGGGEIDLIYRDGGGCVFVEVKQSSDFDRAVQSLRPAQIRRLMQAASVFVAGEPKGQLTDMRFDVALVNGRGETEIRENALWAT